MNKFLGLCIALGLFVIIGTAGSADLGLLDMGGIAARGFIGLGLMLFGFAGLKVRAWKHFN